MNLVLFEPDEITIPLPRTDPRARHVLEVLGRRRGDGFDAGIVDGPRGKARIDRIGDTDVRLSFTWEPEPPHLLPVALIVGLPRPPIAKRILRESTTLGIARLLFAATERGEASYLESRLWSREGYRRYLKEGAAQAFCTRLPAIELFSSLAACLEGVSGWFSPDSTARLLALDNYEAEEPLAEALKAACPLTPEKTPRCVIAVGSERGWSAAERNLLRLRGYLLVSVGARVLKTDTACIAAAAIALSALGYL